MTLSEIATYAGEKVGKTDSDTVTFLKKSASLNYRRVWAFAPWRETVTHSTYSVSTSTRTITLGSNVETPLAVAYGDEELMAADLPTIISQIHAPKFPHLVEQLEFLADVVEDFAEGAYKEIPYAAAAAAAFAIIYTHRLLDIIPDFIAKISFEDDSAVVRAVLIMFEKDFEKYARAQHLNWKKVTIEP